MSSPDLIAYFTEQLPAMLTAIEAIVGHETPSSDKAARDALAQSLANRFDAAGCITRTFSENIQGNHVEVIFTPPGVAPDTKPALILSHFDTVWPIGTLAKRPFRIEDGRAYGPGIFDMKTSIVLTEFAIRAITEFGLACPRSIILLLTSDEEIGSPTSRTFIEDHARDAAYVLVLESPLPGGVLKTARKGVGRFTLSAEGRSAHAGVDPEKGHNAIVEIAHQTIRLSALADLARETTVNVGVIRGGTRSNVVPSQAEIEVDVRVWTADEGRRVTDAILNSSPINPRVSLSASGGINRPAMERIPAAIELFDRAQTIASTLRLTLESGKTGGASDGNFTAGLGIPTLDGLGALGEGAHAEHEHIEVNSVPDRAALLTAFLVGL